MGGRTYYPPNNPYRLELLHTTKIRISADHCDQGTYYLLVPKRCFLVRCEPQNSHTNLRSLAEVLSLPRRVHFILVEFLDESTDLSSTQPQGLAS